MDQCAICNISHAFCRRGVPMFIIRAQRALQWGASSRPAVTGPLSPAQKDQLTPASAVAAAVSYSTIASPLRRQIFTAAAVRHKCRRISRGRAAFAQRCWTASVPYARPSPAPRSVSLGPAGVWRIWRDKPAAPSHSRGRAESPQDAAPHPPPARYICLAKCLPAGAWLRPLQPNIYRQYKYQRGPLFMCVQSINTCNGRLGSAARPRALRCV